MPLLEPSAMPAPPAPPRRVSDVVHEALRREILDGTLAPDDAVPSERTLAERFGVNRHAVREALKRLQQAGLIRISQGGATRVRDWRVHGGFEVLLDLMHAGGDAPPAEITRSVLELRALIGTDAARRAVAGSDAAARERAAALVEATIAALGEPDDVLVARYEDLWRAIVDGADNVAYRLLLNTLIEALAAFPGLAASLVPRDPAALELLATAVRDGDADRAAAIVAAQLQADAAGV